jgi:hypothetical protein
MTKKIRVNITTLALNAKIRKAKRNGRDLIIVPSATLPDNVVMNGIMYPADEIELGYKTLERTPAPFGHPTLNGKFVSASDPEGLNISYIGAWNENVRRENGRVYLDKVIDVEVANSSTNGRKVLEAIKKKKPIHTSTGVLMELEETNNEGNGYDYVARNMYFDHDAILLNEVGAATPEQGVGIFVNSEGKSEEIEVVNSALERAEEEIDWAGMRLVEALQRYQSIGMWESIKSAVIGAMTPEREAESNQEDAEMDKEQFDALSAKVNDLSGSVDKMIAGLPEVVANAVMGAVKPITDNIAEIQANEKAKVDAECEDLRQKIVKANLLDEETAKTLNVNALRALVKKVPTNKAAAALNGAFAPGNDKSSFLLPKGE